MKFVFAIAALGLLSTSTTSAIHVKYIGSKPEEMNQEDLVNKLGHQGAENDDDVTDALDEQKEIKEHEKE